MTPKSSWITVMVTLQLIPMVFSISICFSHKSNFTSSKWGWAQQIMSKFLRLNHALNIIIMENKSELNNITSSRHFIRLGINLSSHFTWNFFYFIGKIIAQTVNVSLFSQPRSFCYSECIKTIILLLLFLNFVAAFSTTDHFNLITTIQ